MNELIAQLPDMIMVSIGGVCLTFIVCHWIRYRA